MKWMSELSVGEIWALVVSVLGATLMAILFGSLL